MPKGENSFQKGKEKTGGREKGVKNKKTEQWEEFAEYCMTGGLEKFQEEMNKLKGEKFVHAFINIMEFHKPKLSRTTLEGDPEKPVAPTIVINKIVTKDVRNKPDTNTTSE